MMHIESDVQQGVLGYSQATNRDSLAFSTLQLSVHGVHANATLRAGPLADSHRFQQSFDVPISDLGVNE